jgi:hypothetical protein
MQTRVDLPTCRGSAPKSIDRAIRALGRTNAINQHVIGSGRRATRPLGKKGGAARWDKLSPERRPEIAKAAAAKTLGRTRARIKLGIFFLIFVGSVADFLMG